VSGRGEKCIKDFELKKLNITDHLQVVDADGSIILKSIVNKKDVRVLIGLKWIR
jgi:hypothetical protein